MKKWLYLTTFLLMYLSYGFYLSQTELVVIPSSFKPDHSGEFYDYRGVTNVRTNLSNGSASPVEVIEAASSAGLDFLFLTDVNQFEMSESLNGYNGSLLVETAGEFNFLDSRLLFYSLNSSVKPASQADANILFADLLSQKHRESNDTLLVHAHPFKNGPTWTGPYPTGLDGLEILNPKSISLKAWMRSRMSVVWSLLIYPFNDRYSFLRLFQEPAEEVSMWDRLSSERPTLAFAGVDASARAVPWTDAFFKFPSYEKSFAIASNHILTKSELTGNYQADRKKIFSALKQGQFYLSLDLLGNPKGFVSYVESKDNLYLMGSTLRWHKGMTLKARLPVEPADFYELVVFKNGERDLTVNEPNFSYPVPGPGVYRVVVRVAPMLPLPEGKKWITWIYTNNFYIQ